MQLPAASSTGVQARLPPRTLLGVGADGPLVTRSSWSPQFFPQGLWDRSPAPATPLPLAATRAAPAPDRSRPHPPGPGACAAGADAGAGLCPHRQYYWYDERGKKVKCTAPQYVDFVMSSVQKLVTDEDVFPTKYGTCLPATPPWRPPLRRSGQPQGLAGAGVPVRLLCGRGHAVCPPAPTRCCEASPLGRGGTWVLPACGHGPRPGLGGAWWGLGPWDTGGQHARRAPPPVLRVTRHSRVCRGRQGGGGR